MRRFILCCTLLQTLAKLAVNDMMGFLELQLFQTQFLMVKGHNFENLTFVKSKLGQTFYPLKVLRSFIFSQYFYELAQMVTLRVAQPVTPGKTKHLFSTNIICDTFINKKTDENVTFLQKLQ